MAENVEDLEWATEDITENKDIDDNGLKAYANKAPPLTQLQNSGFKVRENWPRPIINFLFNNIFRKLLHLSERYAIGDTHTTISAEDATAISTRLGGTWVLVGTQSLAGETNNVFRKTV